MDGSSGSVLKLEIYTEWHWWSGYPRYGCPEYLANTHGPEFYTEAAFPSLKPDIDIFGVPRRSRKQCGWHQVSVPFLGRPSEQFEQRAYFRPPAKASDIPPELFDNILDHLTGLDVTCQGRKRRSMLARCALVCHYWSVRCRESLFLDLGLDSREHALQLLKFMKTPMSATPSLVRGVSVREAQAVTGTPWLHLISVISDRAHRTLREYRVMLKGPLPAGQRMRSFHYQLPRSLPSHFSRCIMGLYLTDIHFEGLGDLMHLVREMPYLWNLDCRRVTWGSLPTALPRRRPNNKSKYGQVIKTSECGPRPVEASVCLAAAMQDRDNVFFSPDDLPRVVSLARGLESGAITSADASLRSDRFYVHLGPNRGVCFCDSRRDFQSPSLQQRHIDTVAFDNRKPDSEGPEMAVHHEPDWTCVDSAVSSFPELARMIVGFHSREDMVRFKEDVATVHMPHLSGSDRLKYALWDPAGADRWGGNGTWLRASPYSDDTEPSGCNEQELRKVYKQRSNEGP